MKKLEDLIQNNNEFNQEKNMDNFIILSGNMVHCADLHGPAKSAIES